MHVGAVAAWDGGGTKTEVLVKSGETVSALFGPLNLNGNAPEQVHLSCMDALHFMEHTLGGLEHLDALVIGAAGVSNAKAVAGLEQTVRSNGYSGPLQILGDHEIALAGALDGSGCVLVSGTGSVCNGRNLATGQTVRTGGYGYLIDDEGSGYAIGRDILRAVVRAGDGRGPRTQLTELVFSYLGMHSIPELITWLYAPETGKQGVAGLGRLLSPALESGDAAAESIAESCARELSILVLTAMRRLGLSSGEAALVGSVLRNNRFIRSRLEQVLTATMPALAIHDPYHTPAEGALHLAEKLAQRHGGNDG